MRNINVDESHGSVRNLHRHDVPGFRYGFSISHHPLNMGVYSASDITFHRIEGLACSDATGKVRDVRRISATRLSAFNNDPKSFDIHGIRPQRVLFESGLPQNPVQCTRLYLRVGIAWYRQFTRLYTVFFTACLKWWWQPVVPACSQPCSRNKRISSRTFMLYLSYGGFIALPL